MTARFRFMVVLMACGALVCVSGCTAEFWDPPQLGRFRPTPAVNVILNSLGVAEGTVKNHVSNILSKMGVRDRTRAVLKAFEMKLL